MPSAKASNEQETCFYFYAALWLKQWCHVVSWPAEKKNKKTTQLSSLILLRDGVQNQDVICVMFFFSLHTSKEFHQFSVSLPT